MAKSDAPTSDKLRDEIDRGEAGDKTSYPDPAASPLGTDDEAAGTPPGAEERARAEAQEVGRPPDGGKRPSGRPVTPDPESDDGRQGWLWVAVAGLVVILIGVMLL